MTPARISATQGRARFYGRSLRSKRALTLALIDLKAFCTENLSKFFRGAGGNARLANLKTLKAFPQNIESCVAQAALQVENGVTQTGGGTDDHALHTTIDANIVRVYRPITSGGFFPSFSVVVFC